MIFGSKPPRTLVPGGAAMLLALGLSMVSAQSKWTLRNPLPTPEPLNFVTSGGGQILALGEDGDILASRDGIAWSRRVSGVKSPLKGAAWTGTQWVVVGWTGEVLTSVDGVAWTPRQSGAQRLSAVAWTGSLLAAAGAENAKCRIWTSTNGAEWAPRDLGNLYGELRAVVWTGKLLVAVGDTIVTSPDGIVWTPRAYENHCEFLSVAWSGNRLVAVGRYGKPHYSADGITWSSAATAPEEESQINQTAVAWTGSRFVVTGNEEVGFSDDGSSWVSQPRSGGYCYSLAWADSMLVGVGSGASMEPILSTSPDGVAWTSRISSLLSPANSPISSVLWTGQRFVALGGHTGHPPQILVSSDGRRWEGGPPVVIPGATVDAMRGMVRNERGIFATGRGLWGDSSVQFLFRSEDGLAWTAKPIPMGMGSVTWTKTRFLAAGNDKVYHSPDGIAWDSVALDPGFSIAHLIWTGTQAVAVSTAQIYLGMMGGFKYQSRISASPDGLHWTLRHEDTTSSLSRVAWTGTQLVAAGSIVVTSPDGQTWVRRAALPTIADMEWTGNRLVAVGAGGSIYESPDGIEWTKDSSGVHADWLVDVASSGSAGAPGTLVVVGSDGVILSAEEEGAASIRPLASPASRLTLRRTGGSLLITAPDLATRYGLKAVLSTPDGRRHRTATRLGNAYLLPLEGLAAGPYLVEVTGAHGRMAIPYLLPSK